MLEMPNKAERKIVIQRKGDLNMQMSALCTFIETFAEKNNKKATDLIPYFTEALVNNSKEAIND